MIVIYKKKFILKIKETYFDKSDYSHKDLDKIYDFNIFIQSNYCTPSSTKYLTSIINLDIDFDFLYQNISNRFRYEILRAENKDLFKTKFIISPNLEDINLFCINYDKFATLKKLAFANKSKLVAFMKAHALALSFAFLGENETMPIAMHCYIYDSNRIRLYLSGTSVETNNVQLIGRSNKLLHWIDIQRAKQKGLHEYDFGGLSLDAKLQGIDAFKRHFGGMDRVEYNVAYGTSMIGRLLLPLIILFRNLKKFRSV